MEAFRLEQFWFTLLHSSGLRELWHPELELVFLLQGTGRVYFSDLKTTYTLREKDIFAVNSFEVQSFELDEDAAALSFWVTPEFVGNVAPELLKYRVNCRSFPNVNAMTQAFKRYRGVTPGEYRRTLNRWGETNSRWEVLEEGSGVFDALLRYAEPPPPAAAAERVQELTVDAAGKKRASVRPLEAPPERGLCPEPDRRRHTAGAAPGAGDGGL